MSPLAHSGSFSKVLRKELVRIYDLKDNAHVLRLVGHSFNNGILILFMEYCANGDLLSYLTDKLKNPKTAVIDVSWPDRQCFIKQTQVLQRKEDLRATPYINDALSLRELVSVAWQICDGMVFVPLSKLS